MKTHYLFFSFFMCFLTIITVKSQSRVEKSIAAVDLKEIIILIDTAFEIEITNTSENKILISTQSEGEYQNEILIKTERTNTSLIIKDDIQPFSEIFNDKLSAHKVIALKVKIKIPEHLSVTIRSNLASLSIEGKVSSLFAELKSGDCSLRLFTGNATINTWAGDILVHTNNASVYPVTKSGIIFLEKMSGKNQIYLNSISGSISVYKTK